ncbi:glycoside hydrolase family 18 protein [Trichoderma novae-zelandiae]
MAWWSSGNAESGPSAAAAFGSLQRHLDEVTDPGEEDTIIFAYTGNDLAAVQSCVRSWSRAECAPTDDSTGITTLTDLSVRTRVTLPERSLARHSHSHLHPRSQCKAIKVVSGDSCASLASKCGISGVNFVKYNSYDKKLCSKLAVGKPVCCSPGQLPDLRPRPKPNGQCATYTVKNSDTCADIAASNGLETADLVELNKRTWGWNGCKSILVGQLICLSKGRPPLPGPVPNAVCGPSKPGTKGPPAGVDLATLNPCPLKACCNIWGSCGTTKEFCTISSSGTGNPGTSRPGENGCISNCGMGIRITYYESWNLDRSCLHMDVRTVADVGEGYTHLHFAFVNITEDLKVSVQDPRSQFEHFKGLSGIKRIAAFGGWSFSVGVDTYTTLRRAIKPEHRDFFATQVVNFLKKHSLDGVDFDWEYPGATDLPIPAGSPDDPANYLKFLQLLKKKLPTDMTLSIAAPASFWYLKAFPIADIARTWDFNSRWASDGCPKGSCLRSHVNMTETLNALAMITKAGVEARQVVVGVASYGRSFKMTDPRCKGPMCTFAGPQSLAAQGACTTSSGYISNAEILDIMEDKKTYSVQAWYDEKTDSDYLIYNQTQWVAYMSKSVKAARIKKYQALNFGGISNWAIDLEDWWVDLYDLDGTEKEDTDGLDELFDTCDGTYETLEDIPQDLESRCASFYILTVLSSQLSRAVEAYKEVSEGYDEKFKWYVEWVKDGINDDLLDFMTASGEGNKYMDCKWESEVSEGSGPCTEMTLRVQPSNPGARYVEYTLRDEDGFYKALLASHNIERDWVSFGEYAVLDPCSCLPVGSNCGCTSNFVMYKNFPRRIKDASKIDVPNPKELVDEAVPKMDELAQLLAWTIPLLRMGSLDVSYEDPAVAFSMPVFMLEDAVESIKKVKEIGEKERQAKTRELVLQILEIVFTILPFVGEAAAAAFGAANFIARSLIAIAKIGEGALTIVEIVEDPLSAPFAILGMLIGPLGVRAKGSRSGFKSAGDARRALDEDKLKLFSEAFRRKDGLVHKILNQGQTCKL